MNVGVRGWIDSEDKMPHDHEVVIVLYAGRWPGRGVVELRTCMPMMGFGLMYQRA